MKALGRLTMACVVVVVMLPLDCVVNPQAGGIAVPGWQDEDWMRAGVMAKLLGPGDPGWIDPEQAVDPPPDKRGEQWVEGAARGKVSGGSEGSP